MSSFVGTPHYFFYNFLSSLMVSFIFLYMIIRSLDILSLLKRNAYELKFGIMLRAQVQ